MQILNDYLDKILVDVLSCNTLYEWMPVSRDQLYTICYFEATSKLNNKKFNRSVPAFLCPKFREKYYAQSETSSFVKVTI